MEDYFTHRSTVRRYKEKEISNEKLDSILERAMRAPTCGNMQLYSVIVTRDERMKERLVPLHYNQPAAQNANLILTICADFNRFTRWCEISGAQPGYKNFHSFIMAMTDAIIFAQQIVTIAEMEGLGTCYLGTVNYNASEISELLDLPDLVIPVASISLGYPEDKEEQCERLPLEAIVHNEKYRHESDSEILEYFADKENLAVNKEFVKENGKECLAQVFTDIRYPESTNETVSKTFTLLLEKKGFKKSK